MNIPKWAADDIYWVVEELARRTVPLHEDRVPGESESTSRRSLAREWWFKVLLGVATISLILSVSTSYVIIRGNRQICKLMEKGQLGGQELADHIHVIVMCLIAAVPSIVSFARWERSGIDVGITERILFVMSGVTLALILFETSDSLQVASGIIVGNSWAWTRSWLEERRRRRLLEGDETPLAKAEIKAAAGFIKNRTVTKDKNAKRRLARFLAFIKESE